MSATSPVLEDSSLLSKLDRALLPIERFMALCTGLAIFSLMFLAVYSVLGRKFFAAPMRGYVDYIEALMPLIAIFGIAYVQREGGHIRMDMLIGQLSGRAMWLLEFIGVVLVLVFVVCLVWGSWAHFDRSFDCARPLCSRDSSADVGLPLWPSKLIVPVALTVLSLRLVLQVVGYGRALLFNVARPVALPLRLSVDEQAKMEVAQVQGAD
jgi:TRAP-type mannitol/chloroaromatic compound transport system permease small subunit